MNDGQTKTAWREVRLGEILRYLDERVALEDFTEYTTITVKRRHGGLEAREKLLGHQIKTKKQFRLVPGAFIISRVQCWHQAYALVESVEPNMIASSNYDQFEISPDMDRRFFWWLSHSPEFTDTVRSSASGVVIEKMVFDRDEWLTKSVRIPPLTEQRRIVARIEELAAKIAEARALRQQAMEEADGLVGSCISNLFGNGVREGWQSGVLGDYVTDDCYGTSEKTADDNSGTPILRMGNIQNGQLDLRDLKYLHLSEKERTKLILQRGDIVVNRTNSAELVGKCAVFDLPDDYSFASYLIRLRLDYTRADPALVAAYVNSPLGRSYMLSEKRQMTGQANVNATKLKALPIALPPLKEQRRIVAYLDGLQAKVDAVKRLQGETAAELDALLPAILDRAFKGEL